MVRDPSCSRRQIPSFHHIHHCWSSQHLPCSSTPHRNRTGWSTAHDHVALLLVACPVAWMSHYEDLQVPWPALSLSLKRFRHRPLCFCLSEWVSVVDSNEIHRAMGRYLLTKPDAADGTEVKLIWVYCLRVGVLFASGCTVCKWLYYVQESNGHLARRSCLLWRNCEKHLQ